MSLLDLPGAKKLAKELSCADCGDIRPTGDFVIVPRPQPGKRRAQIVCFHCAGG